MFIKQIILRGLKQLGREITIGPFEENDSIMVLNGSNQQTSQALQAVAFALSFVNEPNTLRKTILIESEASLEVFIDNTEENTNILPNVQEINLKRVISENKIVNFLNGVEQQRIDLVHFLELLGLSKTYPYHYYLQSNDIHEFITFSSIDRLVILQKMVGFDEFLLAKSKSQEILLETEEEVEAITQYLYKIDTQLKIFTDDENHVIYERWLQRKETIEYSQQMVKIKNIELAIENLCVENERHQQLILECVRESRKEQELLRNNRKTIKELDVDVLKWIQQKNSLDTELNNMKVKRKNVFSDISELQRKLQAQGHLESYSDNERNMLQKNIDEKRLELQSLKTDKQRLAQVKTDQVEHLTSLRKNHQTIVLNSEQNKRMNWKFSTNRKRNDWIANELNEIKKAMKREESCLKRVNTDFVKFDDDIRELNKLDEQRATLLATINIDDKTVEEYDAERCSLLENQRDLTSQIDCSQKLITEYELKRAEIDHRLSYTIGKSIFRGIKSMEILMNSISTADLRERYFGRVIENFKCDPIAYRPISMITGSYLFYHIVDSVKTASELMKQFNESNLSGEINFFVLDQLEAIDLDENELLQRIEFDKKFENVFAHIFGAPSFCRDLNSAIKLSQCSNQTYFTMNSEKVLISDGLIGTNVQISAMAMEIYFDRMDIDDVLRREKHNLPILSYTLDNVNLAIETTMKNIQEIEETKIKLAALSESLITLTQKVKKSESKRKTKEESKVMAETKIKDLQELRTKLQSEFECVFLTGDEQLAADNIHKAFDDLVIAKKATEAALGEATNRWSTLNSFIENHLIVRNQQLTNRSIAFNKHTTQLAETQEILQTIDNSIEKLNRDIASTNETMQDMSNNRNNVKLEIATHLQRKKELKENENVYREQVRTILTEKDMLNNDLLQSTASLQPISIEFDPEIGYLSAEQLENELLEANHQLNIYNETSHFDLRQLSEFKKEKENLDARKAELHKSGEKIRFYMNQTEIDNFAMMQATFDRLADRFANILSKIISNGCCGRLELLKRSDTSNQSSIVFTGLKMFCRLPNDTRTEMDFDVMPNDDKLIVALVFILAVQQCSLSPFYIFDHIDENLNGEYRTNLAKIIRELSSESQFILTSNHIELMEISPNVHNFNEPNNGPLPPESNLRD